MLHTSRDPIVEIKNLFSDCLKQLYVSGPSADSSRLEVQLHWRLWRRSWYASDWQEAYTSLSRAQSSGVGVDDEAAGISQV